MWTEHPAKIAQYGYTAENTISAEDVARAMIELCVQGRYRGGTCLETSKGGNRVLGTWNIPEPVSEGTSVPREVIERNQRPILEIFEREREGLDSRSGASNRSRL